MKKTILPLPEGFALYAEAILNRAHTKHLPEKHPSREETLSRMRSKGLYLRMDDNASLNPHSRAPFSHT